MVSKKYQWGEGVALLPHTQKKHAILRDYFLQYLLTRCHYPTRSFKLVIVDAFSGSGMYEGNNYGSSLIFLDVLHQAIVGENTRRHAENLPELHIECLLCFNDIETETINMLKANVETFCSTLTDVSQLTVRPEFSSYAFDAWYPLLKQRIQQTGCNNVFFNLDQCGYKHVGTDVIRDILSSWKSAEVLLTFMIESLINYLSPKKENVHLEPSLRAQVTDLSTAFNQGNLSRVTWLGQAEQMVFNYLGQVAQFVSPFTINNPNGWRYWLMHFATSYRARQVFNNVLHQDNATQAHYGRAGLNMLSYTPGDDAQLYLFNEDSREQAKASLYDDIPNVVSRSGDTLEMDEFYKLVYNGTPAHSDDIHQMMIDNPDVEILTREDGGRRRKANTIRSTDVIKLKKQRSFFIFFDKKRSD
mgnify:CR=1 FL=1|jgi:three-Cys-motif partner protein|tara:strand:- start:532 stop:1776 length:1245 start_codon:yes stop_codon:yes gene_type:complete